MNSNKLVEYINKLTSKKNLYNLIVVFLVRSTTADHVQLFQGTAYRAVNTSADLEENKSKSGEEFELSATEEKLKQVEGYALVSD